jgi:hypothetical protein
MEKAASGRLFFLLRSTPEDATAETSQHPKKRRPLAAFFRQISDWSGIGQHLAKLLPSRTCQLVALQRETDRGFHQAEVGAAVKAGALETIGVHWLFLQQRGDRVGQLDLAAGTGAGGFQQFERSSG